MSNDGELRRILDHLPPVKAPDAIWASLEAAFEKDGGPKRPAVRRWRWAFAAVGVLALLGVAYWSIAHQLRTRRDLVRVDGSPVEAGQWIETGSRLRVTLKVGALGSVEVEPDTRLRVVTARPGEHRLALARGEIRATISAPPKLFFVDTASGTAIDLGCEYKLNSSEAGRGLLHVTKGWVSFQWRSLESLVPAGASCRTHPQIGPGIPYFDDASQRLKEALEEFTLEKGDRTDALQIILAEARVRDTLTLWHLIQRVDVRDRARVYDRIASLTPPPSGVSRALALQLDPATLKLWKDELAWKW
jgi:FecR protein